MQETGVPSLGREDPLEQGMATHSSILAWRTPWTEELGGLQSMWSQTARHDWATNICKKLRVRYTKSILHLNVINAWIKLYCFKILNMIPSPWKTSWSILLRKQRNWKWSRARLFVTTWTVADQAPPSMGFSRQEYCNGLPFSSPGDLPNPGIKPKSPALQADALPSEPPGKPLRKQSHD